MCNLVKLVTLTSVISSEVVVAAAAAAAAAAISWSSIKTLLGSSYASPCSHIAITHAVTSSLAYPCAVTISYIIASIGSTLFK